jgi:hypothetical protein
VQAGDEHGAVALRRGDRSRGSAGVGVAEQETVEDRSACAGPGHRRGLHERLRPVEGHRRGARGRDQERSHREPIGRIGVVPPLVRLLVGDDGERLEGGGEKVGVRDRRRH